MAALTSTTAPRRHVLGDCAMRTFTLSGDNGDTLTIPGIANIQAVIATPTTAIALGATWSGNVITFVTAGAWAGSVSVISRVG